MTRPRRNTASVSLSAPTSGRRTDTPLDLMEPLDAITLKNMFPFTDGLKTRQGCVVSSSGIGSFAVESLHEFINEAGTRKLLACGDGSIYDATSSSASSLVGSLNGNRWESCKYENKLYMVNGADAPREYNGTAISATAWTGLGASDLAKLCHVSSFKDRMYFCHNEYSTIYYADSLLSSLSLTAFPVGYYLTQGGIPMFTAQFSQMTGDGNENQFVIVGSEGDVLIYRGDFPGVGGNWTLDKRLVIPRPLSRRAHVRIGSDLLILTEAGLLSLRKAINPDLEGSKDYVSKRVDSSLRELIALYGQNEGWQLTKYLKRQLLIVNIPTVEGNASTNPQANQMAFNVETWGVADFEGWDAGCFATYDGDLYMGAGGGQVYKCDTGLSDNGEVIEWEVQQAFVYPNRDRQRVKRFTCIEPVVKAKSSTTLNFALATNFEDIQDSYQIDIDVDLTSWGAAWGSAWSDTDFTHKSLEAAYGVGENVSVKLFGVVDSSQMEYTSSRLVYEMGGIA